MRTDSLLTSFLCLNHRFYTRNCKRKKKKNINPKVTLRQQKWYCTASELISAWHLLGWSIACLQQSMFCVWNAVQSIQNTSNMHKSDNILQGTTYAPYPSIIITMNVFILQGDRKSQSGNCTCAHFVLGYNLNAKEQM